MSHPIRTRSAGISIGNGPLYDLLPDPSWKSGDGFGEPLAIAPDDEDGLTDDVCPECYAALYAYEGETYCPDCTRAGLPS